MRRVTDQSHAQVWAHATGQSVPPPRLQPVAGGGSRSKSHAAESVHLGKGILERDLEATYPDKGTELIMYCGGGFRSALTADVAQKMGYTNVHSLIGGYKGLVKAEWPMAQD